jgi:ATP phosphoribosyltransferase regulatory subunit
LGELYGGAEVLRDARRRLPDLPQIRAALDDLERAAQAVADLPVRCSFDLGELRGYHYHTGIVFAAYGEGHTDAIGRGGRYDEIGRKFGRARPATGFSLDLRDIASVGVVAQVRRGIRAPCSDDSALRETIAELRRSGEVVIVELPGSDCGGGRTAADRELRRVDGCWQVLPVA